MFRGLVLLLSLVLARTRAAQPSAPKPQAAPLRELKFQQLNFLHTTDVHGWHAGHLLEASYSADWGDYIDFAGRLREKVEAAGQDLLVIDTGDRIEGNGLYDSSEPKGKYLFDILKEQHIDLICSGNHELYKKNASENEYFVTVPAYKDNYLASNLDILDPRTGDIVPLAPRYKKFTTKKQGIRIMAFGFLYDFQGNSNNTIVQPIEKTVQEQWFQHAIRDRDVDLFVVFGHAAIRSEEFLLIHKSIREVHWDTPIQYFGGHFHIRDYKKFDSKSYGLASGRFMETIGFQSIGGISTSNKKPDTTSPTTFFRRYIDNNLYSLYHHSGHNASTFHSAHGRNVSQAIQEARSSLDLDKTFGCANQDLWMSRAPYPSNNSIFTWLEQAVLPDIINDTSRADKPRIVITNTGAVRFDIFEGPFTKDSTFIVSPFTSGFHYIKDVPYDKASKLIKLLNNNGQIFQNMDAKLQPWKLIPPEQYGLAQNFDAAQAMSQQYDQQQITLGNGQDLMPGYTTKDDAGNDGDDTLHSPISFYNVPNCIQAVIDPTGSSKDPDEVDVVFNEFIQPWILLAMKFFGLDITGADVGKYMEGENFTTLLAKWVSQNWADNCRN